ncbi:hypothetical protein BX666DRAFT_647578 [Dichotomocladium elegans]|nr:hypothetical protein BX666DRAFT_647578 [Dichotomocladium elegans]
MCQFNRGNLADKQSGRPPSILNFLKRTRYSFFFVYLCAWIVSTFFYSYPVPSIADHFFFAVMESGFVTHSSNCRTSDGLWTSIMPNELLYNIFSRITKADCIESLRVCRHWNTTIPEYAKDVWKSVSISSKKLGGSLPRFLGPHVKEVRLKSLETSQLLDILFELQKRQCHSICMLDITFSNHCIPLHPSSLTSLLPVRSLTTLILQNLTLSDMDLIATVALCPMLLHLSYTARAFCGNHQDDGPHPIPNRISAARRAPTTGSTSTPVPSDLVLPLRTLYFEGNSTTEQTGLLIDLLRRAPGLRALGIAAVVGLNATDLRRIVQGCQELEYFGSDVVESWSHGLNITSIHTRLDPDVGREERRRGLRILGIFEADNRAGHAALPHIVTIKEHQETLEYLIMGVDFDPDAEDLPQIVYTLADTHPRLLKSFSCTSGYFPSFGFTPMLSCCAHLREFRLTTWSHLDAELCNTLARLPALEYVRFCFRMDDRAITEHSLYAFFDAIRQSTSHASRLSTVELALLDWTVSWDDMFSFLEPLGSIPSLRQLVLSGFVIIDDDTMLRFTQNLVAAAAIEALEIRWLIDIADEALENLTKLEHLRHLQLLHCRIPSVNQMKMLESMARRSAALLQVTVCECVQCHEDDEYDLKQVAAAQGSMDWLRIANEPF